MKITEFLNNVRESALRVTVDSEDYAGKVHFFDSDDLNEAISYMPRLVDTLEDLLTYIGNRANSLEWCDIMEILIDGLDCES